MQISVELFARERLPNRDRQGDFRSIGVFQRENRLFLLRCNCGSILYETFVGGKDPKDGTWIEQKSLVVIAAEEDGTGIGRIRMATVPRATRDHLHRFVKQTTEAGSVIHTDGRIAYEDLESLGYTHRRTVLLGHQDKNAASKLLPRVHRIASLFKRWLLGTHQGAVSAEHLDYYLDEFTFRFNRRTPRSRGKLFFRLLKQAFEG